MRTTYAIAASLVLAAASWAQAAPKPQLTVTTKAAELTVTVHDALRLHPGLTENCLAEGRRWADANRAEAAQELKENPEFFAEGRRWTFERSYEVASVVGRYVSVVREDGTYTGGAHPNLRIDTILWDRNQKKRISVRPFFRETADNGPTLREIARLARIAVATEKLERGAVNVEVFKGKLTPERLAELDHQISGGIQPSLLKLGPVTLALSTQAGKSAGLMFHYSPYDVGSYAEGPYTVFVPWTAIRQFLSAEGAAIFGGGLPKGDRTP
jgi:hypothetical protein